MKIVIDIPEDTLKAVKAHPECFNFAHAILDGTPLEKVFEDIKAEIECAFNSMGREFKVFSKDELYDLLDKHISGKEIE